ncbi:DUF1016 N-terminal domain-containing protein [Flavobacterium salmonis]|uniref:YhcG N-terminal domain-containing protein n=1 Tax=Flavobacterium salmonis TaxID=2654844 RepID=A0A6V6Z2T5_9FLAO|nr:hypothetical protein FLAT13_03135 [Flavobacterium salmonis]
MCHHSATKFVKVQYLWRSTLQVSIQANSAITILFWQVGNHINKDILENKRAEYAKQIVSTLSAQLKEQYGSNFELRNLRCMDAVCRTIYGFTNWRNTVTTIELVILHRVITHQKTRSPVILCKSSK